MRDVLSPRIKWTNSCLYVWTAAEFCVSCRLKIPLCRKKFGCVSLPIVFAYILDVVSHIAFALSRFDVCGCGRHNPKCKQDSSKCWNPGSPRQPDNCGQPNPAPVRAPNPAPVSPPVSMPVTQVNPTAVGDRKVRPNLGNKNGSRMAGGSRGGSAGALRTSNRQLKGDDSS